MSPLRKFRLFASLYLLSFAVLVAWVALLIVGFFDATVMAFANSIAVPTLLTSIICVTVFKRLAAQAEKRIAA